MRHRSRETADRLHLLSLPKLRLQLFAFRDIRMGPQ